MLTKKASNPDIVTAFVLSVLFGIAVISRGFTSVSQLAVYILAVSYLFFDGLIVRYYLCNKKVFYRFLILLIVLAVLFFTNSSVSYNSYNGFYYALILCLTFALARSLRQAFAWKLLAAGVIAIVLIDISLTVYQCVLNDADPQGFFESQNSNGALINIVAILSLLFVINDEKADKTVSMYLSFILYAICCVTLFLIGSRGVFIAHLTALFAIIIFLYRANDLRRVLPPVCVLVLAYITSGMMNHWQVNERVDDLLQTYLSIEEVQDSKAGSSIRERGLIWNSAWNMLSDTSVFGSGYSSFHMRYPAYRSMQDTSSGQYAHNDYLQILLEFGYPGLTILLTGLLILTVKLYRSIFHTTTFSRKNFEPVILLLAASSVLVHSLVSYNLYVMPVMILLCLCLGRYCFLCSEINLEIGHTDNLSKLIPVSTYLLLTFPLLAMLSMNYYFTQAHTAYQSGDIAMAEKNAIEAERWFSTENIHLFKSLLYLHAAGGVNESKVQDYMQWAHEETQKAERENTYSPDVHYYRGLVFRQNHQQELALDEFHTTLSMNNRYYMARLEIAKMAEEANNIPMARNILEDGLRYTLPRERNIETYVYQLIDYRKRMGDIESAMNLERKLNKIEPLLKE